MCVCVCLCECACRGGGCKAVSSVTVVTEECITALFFSVFLHLFLPSLLFPCQRLRAEFGRFLFGLVTTTLTLRWIFGPAVGSRSVGSLCILTHSHMRFICLILARFSLCCGALSLTDEPGDLRACWVSPRGRNMCCQTPRPGANKQTVTWKRKQRLTVPLLPEVALANGHRSDETTSWINTDKSGVLTVRQDAKQTNG